jgi:hypothetical protein
MEGTILILHIVILIAGFIVGVMFSSIVRSLHLLVKRYRAARAAREQAAVELALLARKNAVQ